MKDQFIDEVQQRMLPYLNNEQLMQLQNAMSEALQGVRLCYEDDRLATDRGDTTGAFISAKRIEGCSEKTLSYYRKTIEAMLNGISKSAQQRSEERRVGKECRL